MKKNICLAAGIAGILLGTFPTGAHAEGRMHSREWRGGSHWGGRGSYGVWRRPYWVWGNPYWAWNGGYLVIDTRPSFIVLPGYGFSVSLCTPYDMIYYDHLYYIYNNKFWYSAPDCRGPWVVIHENDLPDIIRKHNLDDIREARDIESRTNGDHGDLDNSKNQNDTHRDSRSADIDHDKIKE